jgi:cytochrome c oxidase subunit II
MNRMRLAHAPFAALTLILGLAGCAGNGSQSALDPAGPQAAHIESLWWVFFWVCAAVYVLVIAALLIGLRRGPFRLRDVVLTPDPDGERRRTRIVGTAVAFTALILVVLTGASYFTDRALATAGADDDPVNIEITGHQWWWEVVYDDPTPARRLTTANEIHIPAGRTVALRLRASDVIHSFWAPNFDGKQDLIPGRPNEIRFRSDRIGTFRGQCAEFCGAQHAHMAFVMKVESQGDFDHWRNAQLTPAAEPATDEQQRGRDVFLTSSCVMCHSIRGTSAGGKMAPDLTHVASRETLAAGTIPNTVGHMAAWIVDPQRIKNGVHMPVNGLQPDDLQALLSYLRSLQ